MHIHRVLPLLAVLAAPASAQWVNSISTDEMTGKRQAFARSPIIAPTRTMSFPYTSTQAWLGFGCDGDNEWTYVGFSSQPNLDSFLHFQDDQAAISHMTTAGTVLLELEWYSAGQVYFRFSLQAASAAIAKARAACVK